MTMQMAVESKERENGAGCWMRHPQFVESVKLENRDDDNQQTM
jgi:hypothetical protein